MPNYYYEVRLLAKVKNKTLRFFYGIPHSHTAFSTGQGTPYNAFDYANKNGLDFLAITDHNSYLSKNCYINDNSISRWEASNNMALRFKKKYEDFVPLIGFEANTAYGYFNIINCNRFFTGLLSNSNLLVLWMLNNPDSFITINHPNQKIFMLEYNELLNKLITSIEVGNGTFPERYIRYDKYYYVLLDRGFKLGAINGQNNHILNFGDNENLTVIVSEELTSSNIIDAFRKRTTYSTESRTLKLYFTIDDCFMGGIIKITNKKMRFMVYVEDNRININSIEIVSNKNTVIKKVSDINLKSIKYLYEHELVGFESWFLIRIYQSGNRISISSPIFIE